MIRSVSSLRLALYQPDIAQNTGTLVRMGACLGVQIDLISPAGFDLSDKNFRRSGMDYIERAQVTRHASFDEFNRWRISQGNRLILIETDGQTDYTAFSYRPGDILLLGRESAGVPEAVMTTCDTSVHIPQIAGTRSLNVAIAGAMVMGEALRQTMLIK